MRNFFLSLLLEVSVLFTFIDVISVLISFHSMQLTNFLFFYQIAISNAIERILLMWMLISISTDLITDFVLYLHIFYFSFSYRSAYLKSNFCKSTQKGFFSFLIQILNTKCEGFKTFKHESNQGLWGNSKRLFLIYSSLNNHFSITKIANPSPLVREKSTIYHLSEKRGLLKWFSKGMG